MKKLPLPNLACKQVIGDCVNGMSKSNPKRQDALAVRDSMTIASTKFEAALAEGAESLSQLDTGSFKNDVDAINDTARYLYTDQLVRNHRPVYEEIIGIRDCAYCSCSEAETLDHSFPKSSFPYLSVTPLNLVPCCERCNRRKSDRTCTGHTELVPFNPYFDDFDTQPWLISTIRHVPVAGAIPVFSFDVTTTIPAGWSEEQFARLCRMFNDLQLREHYSRQVMRELSNQKNQLKRLLENGTKLFRDYLHGQANPEKYGGVQNDWHVAAFNAAYKDKWFYTIGAKEWLLS